MVLLQTYQVTRDTKRPDLDLKTLPSCEMVIMLTLAQLHVPRGVPDFQVFYQDVKQSPHALRGLKPTTPQILLHYVRYCNRSSP